MTSGRHRHHSQRRARRTLAAALLVPLLSVGVIAGRPALAPAAATTLPVGLAAPYLAPGWGGTVSPTGVMASTGIRGFTLAFMLSGRGCTPRWDGTRPLLGGADATTIATIRAAGGDVSVSLGGWSGRKLGTACKSATALAAAYDQVVSAYGLRAVDIDIEHTEFTSSRVRLRVVTALAALQSLHPDLQISVTFGTSPTGPTKAGINLITDAARIGFQPYAWTIMPFDFGVAESDMGAASIAAAEGLHGVLMSAYGEDSAVAYAHMGISSMNGQTDEADETVSLSDFQAIEDYARSVHLARLTFWMVNRDQPCPTGITAGDTCSGIAQAPDAFTELDAGFGG
jgi:chitinase